MLCLFMQVLNACVQQKQWEGAFWVMQQLKQHGLQPSAATYGLVMEVTASIINVFISIVLISFASMGEKTND